jgi:hypothetical protein
VSLYILDAAWWRGHLDLYIRDVGSRRHFGLGSRGFVGSDWHLWHLENPRVFILVGLGAGVVIASLARFVLEIVRWNLVPQFVLHSIGQE